MIPSSSQMGKANEASRVAAGVTSRRRAFEAAMAAAATSVALGAPGRAEAKTYKSGKNPDGPPKDPSDTKGTKKDGGYMRCLSGCLSRCQAPAGPGLVEKERGVCLQECRDECCTTYEQCTYTIRDSLSGR